MSDTNLFPYGRGDGKQGCRGCRFIDEEFGMEIYPECIKEIDIDPKFDHYFYGVWKCWEPEVDVLVK